MKAMIGHIIRELTPEEIEELERDMKNAPFPDAEALEILLGGDGE